MDESANATATEAATAIASRRLCRSATPRPFHGPLPGRPEADVRVEPMRVARVEHPADVRVGPALDHLLDERLAEPAALVLRKDVDVGEICDRDAVRDGPREPDLLTAAVHADDPRRLSHEPLDGRPRPPGGPVRPLGQVPVDGVDVNPAGIVVELVPT